MSKLAVNNKLSSLNIQPILPTNKGGTGVTTTPAALSSLHLIPGSHIDAANGVAGLDSNGKLRLAQIPDGLGIMINGPVTVAKNTVSTYDILGYSNFNLYTVSVSAGSVSELNGVISFTAPSTPQTVTMIVNGALFSIIVT